MVILVDKTLYALGFRQISDFITLRGSLSFLETMNYGGDYASRFEEADAYAMQLAKDDASLLFEMRKFISIGVAPGLTSQTDALQIAAACDPDKKTGYGRFMVWAGNCPDGLALFQLMAEGRQAQIVEELKQGPISALSPGHSGNRHHFFVHQHGVAPALEAAIATLSC